MKPTTAREQQSLFVLRVWNSIASQTQKPVECALRMLKHRFLALKYLIKLPQEYHITALWHACLILHKLSLNYGSFEHSVILQIEPKDRAERTTDSNFG